MKKTISFGKIDFDGSGRKNCLVTVEIEVRQRGGEKTFTINPTTKEKIPTGKTTPIYNELSICGNIWNPRHTDVYSGGQCLDTIAEYINTPLFNELYNYWKLYHLNGMHAGTPEQEKAIEEWEAQGNKYEYTAVCEYLKSINLYEVNYTGASVGRYYNNEPYKYGYGWLIQELPADVLKRIIEIINN